MASDFHSPTLSWTLFQVKAWVLQEDWDTLVRQLPEPTSFNVQYDLYRLQNLVTLLELNNPTPEPTFVDVPFDYWAHDYIEMIYQEGYVAGCNLYPHMYCPDHTMNRAESAVFVERGVHGGGYIPADPVTQVFADVPLDQWYAKWANGLWEDGYTAGCDTDPLIYCPLQGHTRTEGSVFFLRMMNGVDYVPPAPVGIFADLAIDWWGTKWAEAAYNEGIIDPCQVEPEMLFCPDNELTRAYAAYMMVKAKGLTLP